MSSRASPPINQVISFCHTTRMHQLLVSLTASKQTAISQLAAAPIKDSLSTTCSSLYWLRHLSGCVVGLHSSAQTHPTLTLGNTSSLSSVALHCVAFPYSPSTTTTTIIAPSFHESIITAHQHRPPLRDTLFTHSNFEPRLAFVNPSCSSPPSDSSSWCHCVCSVPCFYLFILSSGCMRWLMRREGNAMWCGAIFKNIIYILHLFFFAVMLFF